MSCVGDKGNFSFISSIDENTYADKITMRILNKTKKFKKHSFMKRGSNERQFGCQNLILPFVTICRTRFGDYKEYHTSRDNLKIISENSLRKSSILMMDIVNEIQKNSVYVKNKLCEPFLTKYNLVNLIGGPPKKKYFEEIQNIIAYVGKNFDLMDLSLKLKIDTNKISKIVKLLKKKKIIKEFI